MAECTKKKNNRKHRRPELPPASTDDVKTSTLDEELDWCVRQLERGLLRPRASTEQKRESELILKKLRSSKTPLPRKRQLMRATFGDYRSQMTSTNGPPVAKPVIDSISKDKGQKDKGQKDKGQKDKGQFYKHSSSKCNSNGSAFKFNFVIDNT